MLLRHRPTEQFETHLLKPNISDDDALKYIYFGPVSQLYLLFKTHYFGEWFCSDTGYRRSHTAQSFRNSLSEKTCA